MSLPSSRPNPFDPLAPTISAGSRYRRAMTLSAALAPFYFERLVEHQMVTAGCGRARAETIVLTELAHFARHYDDATYRHVLSVFGEPPPGAVAMVFRHEMLRRAA